MARLTSRVQSIIARCAAIDWQRPAHDPQRVAGAYERWLTNLGLARRVRYVTDPADIEAWQARGEGVANVWSIMAAGAPEMPSIIGLLLNSSAIAATVRWSPESIGPSDVAAAWSFAVTSHMAAVETAWEAWGTTYVDVTARKPLLAQALFLLCPGAVWPSPPMVVRAAADALAACANDTVWAALAVGLARSAQDAARQGHLVAGDWPPTQDEMLDALVAVVEPMIEACEAGAFAHTLLEHEVVVLAAPAICTEGRRLHCHNGPALAWPRTQIYAWKGFIVPKELIADPQVITPDLIRAVPDQQQLQHALIDIYAHRHGHRRCMQDLGGVVMHEDHAGRLWWLGRPQPPQPGDFKMVEVTNGTAEPDGSRKTYWLNVPPEMQTARQAVAWTYGMMPEDYDGLVVRT